MSIKGNVTEEQIILCPNCHGIGYVEHDKRINAYETETKRVACILCDGKRVINRKTITTYEVVK